MTVEEVAYYADKVTISLQKTIVSLKDGNKLYGYFDFNPAGTSERKSNNWNFMITPKDSKKDNKVILNGEDIESIEIVFPSKL